MSGNTSILPASGTPSSPAPAAVSKRKHRPGLVRVQIACERCRTRKNKCDGNLPQCSTCKRADVPCVIIDRITHRQQPRGHVEELEAENARLKERIKQLEQEACVRNLEQGDPGLQNNHPTQFSDEPQQMEATGPSCMDVNVDVADTESLSSLPATSTASSEPLFFGNVLHALLLRVDYKQNQGPPQSNYRLRVRARMPTTSNSQSTSSGPRQFVLPSIELADQLQNAYFTHRWPGLPLLHRPSFLKYHYATVMDSKLEAGDVSLFLTLMVFALGAIDLKRQDASFPVEHLMFFNVATENYLVGLIDSENIEAVQGLLLMAVFAVNESKSVNSWHCIGQAVRMAIDLGLHRSSPTTDSDILAVEMKRRVFWSAYALDRNISIALGRPCAIRDADINVPLPQTYNDDDLTMAVSGSKVFQTHLPNPFDMSTFIHTIKLRQIQSRIQDIFYPGNLASISEDHLVYNRQSLREELDNWVAGAPRYSKPTMATFQTSDWFQIAYSHALLLLYRPSPAAPLIGLDSLQICADAAITMISSYSSLYAKNKITYTWIALHSLFMASVTMLYTLWVSPEIRRSTRKPIVKSNVMSCLALFDVMRDHWPLAVRCYEIIDRLGAASIALFDPIDSSESPITPSGNSGTYHFGQIDAEYMEWFGTRDSSRVPLPSSNVGNLEDNEASGSGMIQRGNDISVDSTDQMGLFPDSFEWFHQGFDMTIPIMTDAFGNDPYMNTLSEQEGAGQT